MFQEALGAAGSCVGVESVILFLYIKILNQSHFILL